MLLGNNQEAQKYFIGDISKYEENELIEAIEEVRKANQKEILQLNEVRIALITKISNC